MEEEDHKTKFKEFNLSYISYTACVHIHAQIFFLDQPVLFQQIPMPKFDSHSKRL